MKRKWRKSAHELFNEREGKSSLVGITFPHSFHPVSDLMKENEEKMKENERKEPKRKGLQARGSFFFSFSIFSFNVFFPSFLWAWRLMTDKLFHLPSSTSSWASALSFWRRSGLMMEDVFVRYLKPSGWPAVSTLLSLLTALLFSLSLY